MFREIACACSAHTNTHTRRVAMTNEWCQFELIDISVFGSSSLRIVHVAWCECIFISVIWIIMQRGNCPLNCWIRWFTQQMSSFGRRDRASTRSDVDSNSHHFLFSQKLWKCPEMHTWNMEHTKSDVVQFSAIAFIVIFEILSGLHFPANMSMAKHVSIHTFSMPTMSTLYWTMNCVFSARFCRM